MNGAMHNTDLIQPANRPDVYYVRCSECGEICTPHLKIDAQAIAAEHQHYMEHEHKWGPVESAPFTGTPHRKCLIVDCKDVCLDLDEDAS